MISVQEQVLHHLYQGDGCFNVLSKGHLKNKTTSLQSPQLSTTFPLRGTLSELSNQTFLHVIPVFNNSSNVLITIFYTITIVLVFYHCKVKIAHEKITVVMNKLRLKKQYVLPKTLRITGSRSQGDQHWLSVKAFDQRISNINPVSCTELELQEGVKFVD